MPSIDKTFLENLNGDYKEFHYFIETGTYDGETTFALEPFFDKLYTIEFSEKFYYKTKNRYNGNKINFILGDSGVVFNSLLPNIDEKCIFFLDGHWSGGETGKSEKDCPLYEEVTNIHNLFKKEAIIIIDDVRLFGTHINEDWSNINEENIINILKSRISMIYHRDSSCMKDDRLIIHINAKTDV